MKSGVCQPSYLSLGLNGGGAGPISFPFVVEGYEVGRPGEDVDADAMDGHALVFLPSRFLILARVSWHPLLMPGVCSRLVVYKIDLFFCNIDTCINYYKSSRISSSGLRKPRAFLHQN